MSNNENEADLIGIEMGDGVNYSDVIVEEEEEDYIMEERPVISINHALQEAFKDVDVLFASHHQKRTFLGGLCTVCLPIVWICFAVLYASPWVRVMVAHTDEFTIADDDTTNSVVITPFSCETLNAFVDPAGLKCSVRSVYMSIDHPCRYYNGLIWSTQPTREDIQKAVSVNGISDLLDLEIGKVYYTALCHSWAPKEGIQFSLDTSKLVVNILGDSEFDDMYVPKPLHSLGAIQVRAKRKIIVSPNASTNQTRWDIYETQLIDASLENGINVFVKGASTYIMESSINVRNSSMNLAEIGGSFFIVYAFVSLFVRASLFIHKHYLADFRRRNMNDYHPTAAERRVELEIVNQEIERLTGRLNDLRSRN